jgi:hypothetical protein
VSFGTRFLYAQPLPNPLIPRPPIEPQAQHSGDTAITSRPHSYGQVSLTPHAQASILGSGHFFKNNSKEVTYMLEIAHSHKGTAFHIDELECPGLYINVTNATRNNLPPDPEAGSMVFSLCKMGGEELSACVIEGREGLLSWYAENCGYDPDDDNGKEVPIHELIELVGAHMLHSEKESNRTATDFATRLESWRLLNPVKHANAAPTLLDLRDSLVKLLAILHPGVVGLIYSNHGEEKCEVAIETILNAKALVAATKA